MKRGQGERKGDEERREGDLVDLTNAPESTEEDLSALGSHFVNATFKLKKKKKKRG